jgi:hypothetical protein
MFAPPPLPRTLEASLRDLSSAKPQVRASAIADLVRHAEGAEVRAKALPLLEARLGDPSPAVRAAAAVALGDIDGREVLPALLLRVEDDDAHVRQMAINALGEIGDPRAAPRLRRALRDPRPEVRYQAVIAFARASAESAEVDLALAEAARDEDEAIAHIALRVAEERVDAGTSLAAPLRDRARALLEGGSPAVALAAAILLGKAGDASGHARLLRVVRGADGAPKPEPEDERAAVELVGALGLREAIPHLERRAWGLARFVRDTSKFHARIALARMDHPRAKDEILADLASSRPDVASAAVVAAGRARLSEARGAIAALAPSAADPALVREALALLSAPSREAGG